MMAKQTTLPFKGTPEQEKLLREKLQQLKGQKGALMPALQAAQEIYEYLPREVQIIVAEEIGVPLSEVYGVATFYSQFSLVPKGKFKVAVCLGTACYVKGAGDVIAEIEKQLGIPTGGITADGKFSLDATRCIGCCGLAPVLTVNDDVYGKVVPADVEGILAKYN
ncbi:MAG: NAD(P)H-dependent oxidoreductase subunit E [Clostridiales bacterium]|nr:NAD(P)H-dependent oxidoreductase subunit E [Clostridiales bacterium]